MVSLYAKLIGELMFIAINTQPLIAQPTTLTNVNLRGNSLGEGGGQAIAAVLRVNTTLSNLNLHGNELREG